MTDALTPLLLPYRGAILALGLLGLLYVVQLLVADVIGIRRQHTPGTAVRDDHTDALFRATRAHANTTESIGALILIAGFAIAAGGDPAWVNGALWAFLLLRIVHAFAYYFDLRLLRSIAFAFGMGALFVLFGAGMRAF